LVVRFGGTAGAIKNLQYENRSILLRDKKIAEVETTFSGGGPTFETRVKRKEAELKQKLERLSNTAGIKYKKHYFVITVPSKMNGV
jgi:hypothetical protein